MHNMHKVVNSSSLETNRNFLSCNFSIRVVPKTDIRMDDFDRIRFENLKSFFCALQTTSLFSIVPRQP